MPYGSSQTLRGACNGSARNAASILGAFRNSEQGVGMKVAAHKVRDAVWITEVGGLLVTLSPICCWWRKIYRVAYSVACVALLCCDPRSLFFCTCEPWSQNR